MAQQQVETWKPSRAPLLSMRDIADLAGVQRPVVTTWRRRHAGFPPPATGTDASALFDGRQVCSWLVDTGRGERADLEADLRLHALANLGAILPVRQLVAAVTALVCLHHLDGEPLANASAAQLRERAARADPGDIMLRTEVSELPAGCGLAAAVGQLIEAAWGTAPAFERIMRERGRLGPVEISAPSVLAEVARLMAKLAGVGERAAFGGSLVVADPAADAGDMLTAAIAELDEDCSPIVTASVENPYLARLVRRRLTVHDIPETEQSVLMSGETGDLVPDAIVTQLPYAPAESRDGEELLTAVDEIGLHLTPGRTAAVLGPADVLAGPLPHYSPTERLRTQLLHGGLVEAVIKLPGGLVPFRPVYETAVWVLTSAYSRAVRGRVLLGDVSDAPLTPDTVDGLVADVLSWRRDGHRSREHTPVFCTPCNVADLTDAPGALVAHRRPSLRDLTTQVPETVSRLAELEATLGRLADPRAAGRQPVDSRLARTQERRPDTATVGDLVKAKRLLLVQGSRVDSDDVGTGAHHAVLGTPEVLGRGAGARSIDRGVLAEKYPRAVLTEPGDVVVTIAPTPAVFIDVQGFSVLEFPVRALRIPPWERESFTPKVLAALLQGSVPSPRRLNNWLIPLLPPALVRRFDAVLTRLERRRALARQEIDALDEIARIATTGLTDGTLTIR
ncbi:MAG: hypothetical protein ACRDMV_03310 [Streptosporangiales bacterium]